MSLYDRPHVVVWALKAIAAGDEVGVERLLCGMSVAELDQLVNDGEGLSCRAAAVAASIRSEEADRA